jgi:hypothetical protein
LLKSKVAALESKVATTKQGLDSLKKKKWPKQLCWTNKKPRNQQEKLRLHTWKVRGKVAAVLEAETKICSKICFLRLRS